MVLTSIRKGKSDREVMAFCQSFMTELCKYIGADTDVPAGDIGAGAREIGYMFGQYKRIRGFTKVFLQVKAYIRWFPCKNRSYRIWSVYFTEEMLKCHNETSLVRQLLFPELVTLQSMLSKKLSSLVQKLLHSDSTGWVYDPEGIDVAALKEIKEVKRASLTEYKNYRPKVNIMKDAAYGLLNVILLFHVLHRTNFTLKMQNS